MGLNCSHDAWDGAYSAFHRWRCKIAEAAGLPPLELMEGFYNKDTLYFGRIEELWESKVTELGTRLPIRWDCLKKSPLHELLYHSDCDGDIPWRRCGKIADELEKLLPAMEAFGDGGGHIGAYKDKTQTFIDGLRDAFASKENLEFG